MSTLISSDSWFGQKTWIIENDVVRAVVVSQMGAKLVSLFDKRSRQEWLVAPGRRPFEPAAYGANFVEQDMSGWDEMFPTITPCHYPVPGGNSNAWLPDHGEVWAIPWRREPAPTNSLKFSVAGKVLPYRLTRTLLFSAADTLEIQYKLTNLGEEKMPYIWAAHPQFVCNKGAKIVLPEEVTAVCNTLPAEWGWGEPERPFTWPEAVNIAGHRIRIDRVGTAAQQEARKFYVLPETSVSWAGIVRQPEADWLRLSWKASDMPYLGIWIDEGAVNSQSVVALEPATGFYDSLAVAWQNQRVATVEPGSTNSWTLSVRLGLATEPFDRE